MKAQAWSSEQKSALTAFSITKIGVFATRNAHMKPFHADNIPLGQPILIAHHSESHARKDAERSENGMHKTVKSGTRQSIGKTAPKAHSDTQSTMAVNQGTLYPVLLKLEQEGSIASDWGASENNRRARFYRLTREGRKQLQVETHDWQQTAAIIGRFFEAKAEDLS